MLINIYRVPPQPSDAKPKKLFKRNHCHCAETAYHGLLIKKAKKVAGSKSRTYRKSIIISTRAINVQEN